MKKIVLHSLVIIGFLVFFVGCAKKTDYTGKWYGQLSTGEKIDVTITEDTYKVKATDGKEESEVEYKITGKGFKNSVQYVIMEIEGDKYTFAVTGKKEAGLLFPKDKKEPLNGTLIQALNRDEYPNYEKYAKKIFE